MSTTPVRVARVNPLANLPAYQTAGSAGFDLAPCIGGVVPPKGTLMLPTGLIIETPKDHMLAIFPRGSTYKKYGIRIGNTVGIVDEDYCGPSDEISLFLWNPGDTPVEIPAHLRIAQGIFIPVTKRDFQEVSVSDFQAKSRGGWGSTGQ